MLSSIVNGCRYTASFLLSVFSTDTWMSIIVGAIAVTLLALLVGGFVLHSAAMSTNVLIAAGVLTLFTIPLGLGMYFLNKDQFSSSQQQNEGSTDKNAFALSYLSTFGAS
ncbi:hypothetical protein [Legionella sp. W05-934-2]|jgi:hypothetical protein|uniref:hypothetical protein n=1 Tax=Legionella sp. W05-934-2 TaxID=1198649 RepID=UPI0034633100